jgi:hypothetical protein
MYYHRARYYSQSLRRFIQEDPVEGSTSPYAYVHGSPLEATDPSGMMDSYEMRMMDPRWDNYAHGGSSQGSVTFNGVSISPMAAAGIPPDAIASEDRSSLPNGMGLTPWDMMTPSQQLAIFSARVGSQVTFNIDVHVDGESERVQFRGFQPTSACHICTRLPEGSTVYAGVSLDLYGMGGGQYAAGVYVTNRGWGRYTRAGAGIGEDGMTFPPKTGQRNIGGS